MMDQAARRRPARVDGHVEGGQGQFCPQMGRHCPADHLSAEGVEHDRQITELFGQMHIGDVGDPKLIQATEPHAAGEVGHHVPFMLRVRCPRHEGPGPQAQQIVRPHQAEHPLVIGVPAFAAQQGRDPPVAIVTVGQGQALDRIAQSRLLTTGCRSLPMPVIAGAAHASEPAQRLDPEGSSLVLALQRARRHRLDDRVGVVSPSTALRRRASSICGKAR